MENERGGMTTVQMDYVNPLTDTSKLESGNQKQH